VLKRAVLGSVSSYCLSYANCPVIVAPVEIVQAVGA
jgi:nucleotide-binding universal stress UspA family protein